MPYARDRITRLALLAAAPLLLTCPFRAAAQGVQIRVVERSSVHGQMAEEGGVPEGSPWPLWEEDSVTLAVHGDRFRVEGEWVLDMGRGEMIDLPMDVDYAREPLSELDLGDDTFLGMGGWSWSAEATGEESEVEGLRSRRVLVTSNVRDPLWLFATRGLVFADVWVSDAAALEPLISFQRAYGDPLGRRSPALVFLQAPAPLIEAVLAEVDGFPVKAEFHFVGLEEGTEFRPRPLLSPEGGGETRGQDLMVKLSLTLAGPIRTDIPASLFDPPPGSVAEDAPLVSDTLKTIIEARGIEAAVDFFHHAAETQPWGFRFDFREIDDMAGRHQSDMIGTDSVDSKEAEIALALYGLLVETFPENRAYVGSLGATARMAGQRDLAVESFRRILAIDPEADGARSQLEDLGAGADPALGRKITLSPEVLERYAGEYVVGSRAGLGYPTEHDPLWPPSHRWRISVGDGGLVVHTERGDTMKFFPISETRFLQREQYRLLSFRVGPDGTPTGFWSRDQSPSTSPLRGKSVPRRPPDPS